MTIIISGNLLAKKLYWLKNTHYSDRMRCFDKTTITVNFTSESYINMVDYGKCDFDAPPLLQDIPLETIESNKQVLVSHYLYHS